MVFRYDTVKLGLPKKLDDGRLIAQATLTRTGVFVYRNPDGSLRREYRSPDVVGKADSLEGLKLAPVTNNHPPVMVDASNAKQFVVGQVGQDVHMDGNHVVSTIVINDASTIACIESGSKRDVSCGYACDLVETSGVSPDGERYDALQTNVVYNHLAIVEAGRAGSAKIRMDGAEALIEVSGNPTILAEPIKAKESTMDELNKALARITELTGERDTLAKRVDESEAKAKELELKLTAIESEKAAESKRADSEKARADEAVKSRTDSEESFQARVRESSELISQAVEFLGRNDSGEVVVDGNAVDVYSLSARALRCLVVEKLDGIKIDEKRSDDAVSYAYELATSRAKAASAAVKSTRSLIVESRKDSGTGSSEEKARAASQARNINAWKETK